MSVAGQELHPISTDAEEARFPRGVPWRQPSRDQFAGTHAGIRRR